MDDNLPNLQPIAGRSGENLADLPKTAFRPPGVCAGQTARRPLFASVGVLALTFLLYWLLTPAKLTPRLQIEPSDLDFGMVHPASNVRHTIRIRNASAKSVEVAEILASCACTSIMPRRFSLGPNQTRKVEVTLDLSNPVKMASAPTEKTVSIDLTAITGDLRPELIRWRMGGQLAPPPFEVIAGSFDFGEQMLAAPIERTIRLRLRERALVLSIDSDEPATSTRLIPVSNQHDQFDVQLTVFPEMPAGNHDFDVRIQIALDAPLAGPDPPSLTFRLPVCVQCKREVHAIPPELFLGVGRVSEMVDGSIVLESRRHFSVADASILPRDHGELTRETRPGDSRVCFRIRTQVVEPGSCKGTLRFRIQCDKESPWDLDVPFSYHGYGSSPNP